MAPVRILPEELMMEILSKLPPESLLRFKCVQKSWYALINDPKFATKHFSNSLLHKHVLLRCPHIGKDKNIFCFLKLPLSLDLSLLSFFNIDFPFEEDFQLVEIGGHSHGLICLTVHRRDICLWNPLTREFRKLPPSILLLTEPPIEHNCYYSFTKAVGFGYDSKSRDFKVVRVVDFVKKPNYIHPSRVEIYDLSKDRWREIETPVFGNIFSTFKMYHEGICYWWGITEEGTWIIQTFDMSGEVFGKILLPENFDGTADRQKCLGVFDGSIVLFHYPLEGDDRRFDMWGMEKDESNKVSWSKILTIGSVFGIEKGWLILNPDELLMEANEGQLILYNNTRKGLYFRFYATVFVKSLISVKGGNNITYEF